MIVFIMTSVMGMFLRVARIN